VIWGVANGGTLEKIGAELSRDREVKPGADGTLHTHDVSGFAIGFCGMAPARKPSSGKKGAGASRMNHPFDPERRARPMRIGHVVYGVRRRFERRPRRRPPGAG
jgi:hypothetical protein